MTLYMCQAFVISNGGPEKNTHSSSVVKMVLHSDDELERTHDEVLPNKRIV